MELTTLLSELIAANGSDLHLVVGQPPAFRANNELMRRDDLPRLDAEAIEALLLPHLPPAAVDALTEGRRDVEITLRVAGQSFRVHVYHERGNLAANLRPIPNHVPTLEELGLGAGEFPILQQVIESPRGLVLVVGPTGSGKTTTCAAMVETINQTRAERILTIEEPIEYEFTSKKSIVTQRSVGEDVPTFTYALRSAFREDPDVILLSELRDIESISLALSLAESGHLIFTTLHVENASDAVRRLIEVYPESQRDLIRRMVSRTLVAVIAQRLLRRVDRPGRVPANEIMTASPRVRQMILEGQTDLSVAIEAGRSLGMQTLDDSFVKLFEQGAIDYDTAVSHVQNRERIRTA